MNLKYCMSYDEASEIIKKLENLLPIVAQFATTVDRKEYHKAMVYELKKLYEKCAEVHFSYNPEYSSEWNRYKTMVNLDYKTTTKEKMDGALKYCKLRLAQTIELHIHDLSELQSQWIMYNNLRLKSI